MENLEGILWIVGVCILVLLIVFFRRRVDLFINFVMRGVVSFIAIYFLNEALLAKGFTVCVSMNYITFLTTGILGFPGLLLVYGMWALKTFVTF